MSEERLIDAEAVLDLYKQFLAGAVLDGKCITDVLNPYDYCVGIVKSWSQNESLHST